MKKIFELDDHHVEVEISRGSPSHVVNFHAKCGETDVHAKLNMQVTHEHTAEQAQKDLDDFAERLAKEAAGREHSRLLLGSIFDGETKDEKPPAPSSGSGSKLTYGG